MKKNRWTELNRSNSGRDVPMNDESLLTQAYRRYLQNRLRDRFGFSGNPIQVLARSSAGRD